jgi:RNA polymerase sigma-70 factor (ECF subfamily)
MKTDAQLIREARRDPEAFADLYRRHAAAIHCWLRARTPERIAVELTAETFAQAALSLRRFDDRAGGSAAPWLYGIARNLLRRFVERERVDSRARQRLGIDVKADDEFERAEERATAERLRPELALALASLPRSQREAVELRVVGDLSYKQVATRLGCSELAARIRVSRGLNALARAFKPNGAQDD